LKGFWDPNAWRSQPIRLIDLVIHAGLPREAQRTDGQPNWTTRDLITHHRNP
jgi:hypothetical protein